MNRNPWRPWAITAAAIALLLCAVAWPRDTLDLAGAVLGLTVAAAALVVGTRMLLEEHRRAKTTAAASPTTQCTGCIGCGGPDCIERPEDAELTAQEARELADDLGLQLYHAQDAVAFVRECCDIADREGRQPTTADVRAWLAGPQCARQAGLVLAPDASGPDPDTTGQQAADQPGPDPDPLRTRVGTAIRRALKARTVPALVDGMGRPISGTEIGLSEYDIADVALAELAPELGLAAECERVRLMLLASRDVRARIEREDEAHRTALAAALKCDPGTWPDLIEMAAATERDADRAEERVEELRQQLVDAGQRADCIRDAIEAAKARGATGSQFYADVTAALATPAPAERPPR